MQTSRSAKLALWVNRGILLILPVLAVFMPRLLHWYATIRPMKEIVSIAIAVAYYACLPATVLALWAMEKILRNLLAGDVFVWDNVRRIRHICLCCVVVCILCLAATFYYPPLVFLCTVMGFLALVVNVLSQVMRAAVEIREENDLTV